MMSGLTEWHLIVLLLGIVPFVLWVIALVQIALSRTTAGYIVAWIAITTLVPLIGSILWFTLGRSNAPRNRTDTSRA